MSAARAKKKPQEEFNLFDALKMLEKEKGIVLSYSKLTPCFGNSSRYGVIGLCGSLPLPMN